MLDVGNARSWLQSRSSGEVAVAWFDRDASDQLHLVPLDGVNVTVTPADLFADRMRVPINLAFQGLEERDLKVDRVELIYPQGLNVRPAGHPRISADGRTHVYEHDLRVLAADHSFVPLDTIDVVTVPYHFVFVPSVVLTKDKVPFYLLAIAGGYLLGHESDLHLRGVVHFRDRKPVSFHVQLRHEGNVEILGWPEYRGESRPTPKDKDLFRQSPAASERVSVDWNRRNNEGTVIGFTESRDSDGRRLQRVTVDGHLVRLIVDEDRDGDVDFELADLDRDGRPETKLRARRGMPMPPWPANAV